MKCAWQAYINLLPQWMRTEVDKLGYGKLQELRIRSGFQPELILSQGYLKLSKKATHEDIVFIINLASQYSPWTAHTAREGYITAHGGHRIGICGLSIVSNDSMQGISYPTSLCMRVAADFENIAQSIANVNTSILIIGPPGSGKTTLLRDLIRCKSDTGTGSVCVVDEREEIFPLYKGQACFYAGMHTDIISRSSKSQGINAVLRCMNPEWIAVDEITSENDCDALIHAGWCGVNLIATAHAASLYDLKSRPIYKLLLDNKLFTTIIVMKKDKSWTIERIHS